MNVHYSGVLMLLLIFVGDMIFHIVVLCVGFFFFSSRRRYTICALVTGVQTCSLPSCVVRIDPATVQNLGVRTAPVERRVLASAIRVPGTITWDLRQAIIISARTDAVVSKLDVRAPYTVVKAGEPLAELLAPQWNSALAEYGALQQAQSADAKDLRAAARQRLQVLGLTPADIRAARRGSGAAITTHAPQAGVVTTLDVREGQRVSAGQTLMTVNGLSTVWIEAALPQAAAGMVRSGTPVTVTVDALPGRAFHGTVET